MRAWSSRNRHDRLHSRVIAAAGDEVAALDDGSVGLAGRIRQGLRVRANVLYVDRAGQLGPKLSRPTR